MLRIASLSRGERRPFAEVTGECVCAPVVGRQAQLAMPRVVLVRRPPEGLQRVLFPTSWQISGEVHRFGHHRIFATRLGLAGGGLGVADRLLGGCRHCSFRLASIAQGVAAHNASFCSPHDARLHVSRGRVTKFCGALPGSCKRSSRAPCDSSACLRPASASMDSPLSAGQQGAPPRCLGQWLSGCPGGPSVLDPIRSRFGRNQACGRQARIAHVALRF